MLLLGHEVRVEDADTGEQLHGVMSVKWECKGAREPAVCTLVLHNVLIDVTTPELPTEKAGLVRLAQEDPEC